MKKILITISSLLLFSAVLVQAGRIVYNSKLVNEPALAYNNSYILDLGSSESPSGEIDYLSMQAVYSSATISTVSLLDGKVSTGTLTVNSVATLSSAAASSYLTISSTNGIRGMYLTYNGLRITEGSDWYWNYYSTNVAVSIKNAINTMFTNVVASTGGGSIVFATQTVMGTFGNNYKFASQLPAKISTVAFSGGRDSCYVGVNGVYLQNGIDWTALATASATARAISNAFMANTSISSLITSTWTSGGVVFATSTVGLNTKYSLTSSNPVAISTSNGGKLYGGLATAISTNTSSFFKNSHGLTNGLQVLFTGATPPSNLANQTTYYAIAVDVDHFKLASTLAKATTTVPTAIVISTQATWGDNTYTFAPLALSNTSITLNWQASNDGANWSNMAIEGVIVSTTTDDNTMWDFENLNCRYIKLNVTGITSGGLNLVVTGRGKNSN